MLPRISRHVIPVWLNDSRWKPRLCLSLPGDKRLIAIDVIPSAVIPRVLYKEVVSKLLISHRRLRVIVLVNESAFELHQGIKTFCSNMGIGLKSIVPNIGLQTVCATDLDTIQTSSGFVEEPGWFPESILQRAMHVSRISFTKEILRFVNSIRKVKRDKEKVTALVFQTIDRLLQSEKQCPSSAARFMKLDHFENLFRQAQPDATDHVLHSFRVFLAGCCVVDQYYDHFVDSHARFCNVKRPQPEYTWLLASIFHDIGKPKEKGGEMLETEIDDEDISVRVETKKNKWNRDCYKTARALLASLGAFVGSSCKSDTKWDLGAFPDKNDARLITDWTRIYNKLKSHAVISSLDMLADISDKAKQAGQRQNRSFVASHAVPAALAILLHDWHIWEEAKKWKLFPIDLKVFPMAGLLVYIDTWDDFRRIHDKARINITDFRVDQDGVSVDIEWDSGAEYQNELRKYIAFEKAITKSPFEYKINARVAGR